MRILLALLITATGSFAQITVDTYRSRRDYIKDQLAPGERMIVLTNPVRNRNGDQDYLFRPDSDFWYVTGFHEPMAALVLSGSEITLSIDDQKYTGGEFLFLRTHNKIMEVYNGHRVGVERAPEVIGVAQALNIDTFADALVQILSSADTLYVNFSRQNAKLPLDALAAATLAYLPRDRSDYRRGPLGLLAKVKAKMRRQKKNIARANKKLGYKIAGEIIHPMRFVKSDDDMVLQQRTIDITGMGHRAAMMRAKPGLYEYQLQATIEGMFKEHGARRLGFNSIVASGDNALTLHYHDNNRMMEDGDLVLIDIGAEYEMYSADVTRTIPVNGRFSDAQKEIYNYVLEAQIQAANAIKPGATIKDLNAAAKAYLETTGFSDYIVHGVTHWLGLDVHDVGGYNRPIAAGAVFTIEPGLYIPVDAQGVDAKYRGIGVRIEDDYLATEDGFIKLTEAIPSTIEQVEEAMGNRE